MDASGVSDVHRTGEISGKHGLRRVIVGYHVDASGALDLHRTALIREERGLRLGPRFHQFRAIRRLKFHCKTDGPHVSREFFFQNRCIISSSLKF